MPRVSTALNVLNFIVSVKGGDAEILELISLTWTVPNYSTGITASPGDTGPDLPCSATAGREQGDSVGASGVFCGSP